MVNKIKNIIDKWIKDYTVPYNTPFSKQTVEIFTSNREGQNLDDMFGCRFLFYNNERRILINNKFHYYDFYLIECDKNMDYKSPSLTSLIYQLLDAKHIDTGEDGYEKYGFCEDEYQIKIERLKELEKFFNINFNIKYDRYGEDYISFEGNGWDQDAEHELEYSNIFIELKNTVKSYLQYEWAPYRKYNPDFDPFKYDKPNKDFDKIFELLSKEQIIKVLVTKIYDSENSLISKQFNEKEFRKLLNMMDIDLIKQFILSCKDNICCHKSEFIHICNELYNL